MGGAKRGHKGDPWSGARDGVSLKRASRRTWMEAQGQRSRGRDKTGQRESSRPYSGASDRGGLTKWGKLGSDTAKFTGDQRSSGLGQWEPSRGPGNQYLDKCLHLQVEFDNLLVADSDVDILGGRHV